MGKRRTQAFAAARAVPYFPARAVGAVTAAGLLAEAGTVVLSAPSPAVAASFVVPTAVNTGATAWWWFWHVSTPMTTNAHRKRAEVHQQRNGGCAGILDVAEVAGVGDLRDRCQELRPSLYQASRVRRCLQPVDPWQLGVLVAQNGRGWWGQRVWSSCEDVTLRMGGPRTGKSISLAVYGWYAPGALVTTSTRLDLAMAVHEARKVRPVHFFNPANLGGIGSTVRWSILQGCKDYDTAVRRARDMIPESKSEDGERWDKHARRIFATLLHAAALADLRMSDVQKWVGGLAGPEIDQNARSAVISALLRRPDMNEGAIQEIRNHCQTPERTRGSIMAMINPAMQWMSDARGLDLGDAPVDQITIDVRRVFERKETLHILGREDGGALSSLTAALVGEVLHQARSMADANLTGRLDPPATFLLDEAALVARVPLDRMTADMGGRNITLHICLQSFAQMIEAWGGHAARAIMGNVGCFVNFGGSADDEDLKRTSTLTGEHRERILDADGRKDLEFFEHRFVPVLTAAQIRAMRRGDVVVLMRGLDAFIGRAPAIWEVPKWTKGDLTSYVNDRPVYDEWVDEQERLWSEPAAADLAGEKVA